MKRPVIKHQNLLDPLVTKLGGDDLIVPYLSRKNSNVSSKLVHAGHYFSGNGGVIVREVTLDQFSYQTRFRLW